ncbi:MAG: rod shape-determining protein MreC [Nitrospirae bacterium RIFCSPLOW2_12_42_9]|nr:MAG: rod shape-determining protein MreC [Nitrospirae bacterium RIFCSPLOW2_12_42_9]OGW68734.1 MAG: rod shape-determining protein MreC [Nitrospirae bacterium RIFCSPHIGHO2_02_FULL_40_19]
MIRFLSINKKLLIAFLLLIGVFVLLSPEIKENPRYYLFEKPFSSTVNLIQSGFFFIFDGISNTWNGYIYLINIKEENNRLIEENNRLKAESVVLQEKALAGDRLQQLLDIKDTLNISYNAAGIIAKDPSNWYSAIVINKGERDRLRPNLGVITAEGVVGRIVKTAASYSRVLLLTDRNSAVAGLIQRTGDEGIVAGMGGRTLQLNFIMIDSEVQNGDLVITSGTDGVFPPGIVIGTINKIESPKNALFHTIELIPGVDLSRVREVMVLKTPLLPEVEKLLKEEIE